MTATADIETLWHDHHAKLTRYVRHRFPAHLVEDMVQDVYLSALEAMHRGNGYRESASGWLHRMAHNAVVDAHRAWGREPETVELDALQDDDTVETNRPTAEALTLCGLTPHELAEQAELATVLHRALDQLIDEQRYVIVWRMEGYEFDEIAAGTGRTVGALKAVVQRGYKNMYRRLAPYRGREGDRAVGYVNCSAELRAALQQRGPMTARELATAIRATKNQVVNILRSYPADFVCVGTRPRGQGMPMYVWGLVGVHDKNL